MSHQVLARRYRPKTFDELLGQQHVLKALVNALNQQRLHHAYLFSGTRGVGKTTIARIFAKALNCEHGVSATPCGQCANCQAIDDGRFIDLIEVDAASRTRVEDTRDLLDNVQYRPTVGRYKVYLIDEVHMLSNHSFNALLKTLEEPPPHVVFLLATTDPQKLPITVLSRCLQFNLKHISSELIAQHLRQVLDTETISYEADALTILAKAANGSVRDALSLLEQAISYSEQQVTAANVHSMLGSLPQQPIAELLQLILKRDAKAAIHLSQQLAENGQDFMQVIDGMLQCLHDIAITQSTGENTASSPDWLTTLAQNMAAEDVQLWYQMALIGKRDLPLAAYQSDGFNMLLLRMIAFQPRPHTALEADLSPAPQKITENKPETIKTSSSAAITKQPPPTKTSDALNWPALVKQLPLKGPSLLLAEHCALKAIDDNSIHLHLAPNYKALMTKNSQNNLQQALCQQLGRELALNIDCQAHEQQTPALIKQAAAKQAHAAAQTSLEHDPQLQELLSSFDAKVSQSSVKARTDKVQS